MPEYGDVIYNITDMYVAALQSDNTFGTPAQVEYGQDFELEFEVDEDEIKSYGMIVEKITIITKAMGTLREASLKWDSKAIMTGMTEAESGSTPDEVKTLDVLFGGAGLPYFGLIVAGACTQGNVLIGGPKCKLDNKPALSIQQNTFRIGEAGVTMLAPSTTIRKAVRLRKHETTEAVPATAGDFDTFFSGYFD